MKNFILILVLGLCLASCYSSGKKYVNDNPDLPPVTRDAILNGDIHIGMTPEQVEASLGEPSDKNQTIGRHSSIIYYYYPSFTRSKTAIIYFDKDTNGIFRVDRVSVHE